MKTKIVAFLQNPWFPPGTKKEHIDRYNTDQAFHQRLLRNTMSGQRLMQAFGEHMFKRIWWDNVSPEAADEAKGITPADMAHIERVIDEQGPDLVLCFGKSAKEAIDRSAGSITRKIMYCHHPNARYKTQDELNAFAHEVWDYCLVHDRNDEFTKEDK